MPILSTQRTQSVTAFRLNAAETLERINKTGEAEILTVNGEAKAVLVSPAEYDALVRQAEFEADIAAMKRALQEAAEGKGRPVREYFAELRSKLLAMKQDQAQYK